MPTGDERQGKMKGFGNKTTWRAKKKIEHDLWQEERNQEFLKTKPSRRINASHWVSKGQVCVFKHLGAHLRVQVK